MQHVVSTPFTYPGSCKSCFSRIPVFGRKISLIFPIIYQIAHLHNWPTWPDELFDLCWQLSWMTCLDILDGIFEIISHSWLLNFIETGCASFDPFNITFKSISHAKTSLFVNCAGGTQGVQLLDWSNKGQVRAIRLRQVWVTWYPTIWCCGGVYMVAPGGHVWLLRGGMHGCSGGACMVALGGMRSCSGGHAWLLWGHAWLLQGVCMVALGGVHGCSGGMHGFLGGVHSFCGGHAWFFLGGCVWFFRGACMVFSGGAWLGYDEIRSMSRQYASCWNAFLFKI